MNSPQSNPLSNLSSAQLQAYLKSLPRELLQQLDIEIDDRLNVNRLPDYRPYTKQKHFHELGLTKNIRLLRAGNQNGKTFSVSAEIAMHATGLYPDWWEGYRFDCTALGRPLLIWAAGETAEATRDTVQLHLFGAPEDLGTGWIPKHLMAKPRYAAGTADLIDFCRVKHVSGRWTTIKLKYFAQGRKRWQAATVDAVWWDEEPPEDIFSEGLARTIASNGISVLSFTPLQGWSNVVLRLMGREVNGETFDTTNVGDVNMTIDDAEHIPADQREAQIAKFPEHEREARRNGIPIVGSGRIYQFDKAQIGYDPFVIPADWPRIAGIDFGSTHPTAVAWLALDRDTDTVYMYAGYRQMNASPIVHAAAIKAKGVWIPVAWPADGHADMKDASPALMKQYRTQGVNMRVTHAQMLKSRADELRRSTVSVTGSISDLIMRMETGRFKVANNIDYFWEELRMYHRDEKGEIVKVRDDLLDAMRYAHMDLRFAKTPPMARTFGRGSSILDSEVGV